MAGSTILRVTDPNSHSDANTAFSYCPSIPQLQTEIDQNWTRIPKQKHVKQLLVESAQPVDLHALAEFWALPMWGPTTDHQNVTKIPEHSWLLATCYLRLGRMKEARALTLNGSFVRQCDDVPIASIVKLCKEKGRDAPIEDFNLPIFSQALHSCRTPQTMEAYCLEKIPPSCKYADRSMKDGKIVIRSASLDRRMKCVDLVGASWGQGSRTRHRRTPSPNTASTETQIQLILVCGADADERHTLSVGSSATLKKLFNDYAKERGASLRSLRFSYHGNTLFLSSVGNKTPEQLNMRDRDVITVYGTSTAHETGSDGDASKQKIKAAPKKAKATKQRTKKLKGKAKKEKQSQQEKPAQTLDEWKAEHSTRLSKLHEEVHHRLKEIRTRLNALDLKRQHPKKKRKNRRKTKMQLDVDEHRIVPHSGIGGKAGKTFFSVQIGEVQHLYKTTNKPSHHTSRNGVAALLDLHGCTREEALRQLEARLPVWMDDAMRGSYPFVMPATIVCGGGNQRLSEAVEKWIREHAQVANAIKSV